MGDQAPDGLSSGSYYINGYGEISRKPTHLKIYGASDYATLEAVPGKDPDYTEHGIIGVDHISDIWVLDWWFKQCTTDKGIAAFIRLVGLWKPLRWWNEGGLIDKAIGPAIRQQMRLSQRYVSIDELPSINDKEVKVQGWHSRMTAGTIHWPIRRKWVPHVVDQHCKFPGGKHDDAVDVGGLFGRGLDKMYGAHLPTPPERPMIRPFTEAWLTANDPSKPPAVRYFS